MPNSVPVWDAGGYIFGYQYFIYKPLIIQKEKSSHIDALFIRMKRLIV